jgi:RNA polymerase sigma-70 factor (ECF subfamily)
MPLASAPTGDERAVLDALRAGDEAAFARLVRDHTGVLLAVARCCVPGRAEQVVRDTWLAVIDGLDRYDGRASLKSWIVRTCMDAASAHRPGMDAAPDSRRDLDSGRFHPRGHRREPGRWATPPAAWPADAHGAEANELLIRTIAALPPRERAVIALRDVAGLPREDIGEALGLSGGEQRAALHRARTRTWAALERHFQRLLPTAGAVDRGTLSG